MKKVLIALITMNLIISCNSEEMESFDLNAYEGIKSFDDSEKNKSNKKKSNWYTYFSSFKPVKIKNTHLSGSKNSIGPEIIGESETIEFTAKEKEESLFKSIQTLNSYGITNAIIIEEFGNLDNPEIILTALAVTRIDI